MEGSEGSNDIKVCKPFSFGETFQCLIDQGQRVAIFFIIAFSAR
jgi:hypothetical protein